MTNWKRDVASGLVVLVPIVVTLWFVLWIYAALADLPLPRQAIWTGLFGADRAIDEFAGVVLTVLVFGGSLLVTGYLMRSAFGRVVERRFDDLVNRIPGLRIVYNASKTAVATALSDGIADQTPVKIEVWDGMHLTAFRTGRRTADGRLLVFMPTAPNVTSGFLMEVDPADVVETDEHVEDALGRILSAGFGDSDRRATGADPLDRETKA